MVIKYEIILATCNGELYIEELLTSLLLQTVLPDRILISDDCSTDRTIEIVNQVSSSSQVNIELLPSSPKRLGSCRNFERLLSYTFAPYVLLADQDDFWYSNKAEALLSRTNEFVSSYGVNVPLLVHSDLRLIDSSSRPICESFFQFQKLDPELDNFLSLGVQNIVTGCSCLINQACIQASLPFPDEIIMHDWWLALVAARNGKIMYEDSPLLSYRQHYSNTIGAKGFYRLIITRFLQLFESHTLDIWIGRTLRQLLACNERYPFSNDLTNIYLRQLIHPKWNIRLNAAKKLKLRKHGNLRTLVFYIALILWNPSLKSKVI